MFRIGLHLGDLIVDGDDLYGDGVNVAARLEAEAPPGGIVISRAVHEAVAGRLKATFEDLGESRAQEHRAAGAGFRGRMGRRGLDGLRRRASRTADRNAAS